MGYILPEIYEKLISLSNDKVTIPKILIETGTFKGGLAHRFLETYNKIPSPFEKIYTFELGEDICKVASNRFKLYEKYNGDFLKFNFHSDDLDESFSDRKSFLDNKITIINDDSVSGLKKLLPTITERCCFWLDAHAGASKYARGAEDVPLLNEIRAISNHHIKNHIIAIDDSHLFGKKQYDSSGQNIICDYSEITTESVINEILKINNKYQYGISEPYGHEMFVAYI
jgi:hypothetical protein